MRNRIKKLAIIGMIVIISILFTGIVNAASVRMNLTNDSKLTEGNIITVTFKISNIDAGEGIDAIGGTLNYDENVFEEVTEDSFVGINRWNIGSYNSETGKFTVIRSSKVDMVSDVLSISLKAKDSVSVNSSIIEIKDITASGGDVASGGTGDIQIQAVNVTVSKESTAPVTNEIVNEVVNETTNTQVNKVTNTNTSTGKLPQTGEGMEVTIGIAVIAIIAIIAYIKYRNINIK